MRNTIYDISQSEIIISSSLHGIILADAFGIDSIILKSNHENPFKYNDYLLGTGREVFKFPENLEKALKSKPIEKCNFDYQKLINSFPLHLYQ